MTSPGPPAPPPPPTHPPLDMGALFQICRLIMERTGSEPVTPSLLEEIAEEEDLPRSHAYAAMQFNPNLAFQRTSDSGFAVCVGQCQRWGSLKLLEGLLQLREERAAAGLSPLDILPQGCLNICEHPPAVVTFSPDGVAALPRADEAALSEAVAFLSTDEEPGQG